MQNRLTIILNLTQHNAQPAQFDQGLIEPYLGDDKDHIKALLNVSKEQILDRESLDRKAKALAEIAEKYYKQYKVACNTNDEILDFWVLTGGLPYLMKKLDKELELRFIRSVQGFSERIVSEKQVDGKTIKTAQYVHEFFYDEYGNMIS